MTAMPHDHLTAHQQKVQALHEAAKAKAAAFFSDDNLARAKGGSPQQIEARKRVAFTFCDLHLPDQKPEEQQNLLADINYGQPVIITNGRLVNMNAPKSKAPFGLGAKRAYAVSTRCPPKSDADPIYCMEYIPFDKHQAASEKLLKKALKMILKFAKFGKKKK